MARQQVLWDNNSIRLDSFVGQNICVGGDLNEVQCVEETRSKGMVYRYSGTATLNHFIDNNF